VGWWWWGGGGEKGLMLECLVLCHTLALLAIYIKKYLKAKEELWKLKYFTMQRYNLHKIL
jgi:hypothetical protein